jgi:hypothetical protein
VGRAEAGRRARDDDGCPSSGSTHSPTEVSRSSSNRLPPPGSKRLAPLELAAPVALHDERALASGCDRGGLAGVGELRFISRARQRVKLGVRMREVELYSSE